MVDALAGGVVEAGGSQVTFPPAAFVNAKNQPIGEGEVGVTLTPLDPSGDQIAAFPGGFLALSASGDVELLQTVTLAEIVARDAKGEPLQLAPGTLATLELLIPPSAVNPTTSQPYADGDTVPLYWLNPATGVWEPEGIANVVASSTLPGRLEVYALIPHLSWWNGDDAYQFACLTGRVVDQDDDPIADAEVISTGVDYQGRSFADHTDSSGQYCVFARPSSIVSLGATISADGFVDRGELPSVATSAASGPGCIGCTNAPDLVIDRGRTCVTGSIVLDGGGAAAGVTVGSSVGTSATTDAAGDYCIAVSANRNVTIFGEQGLFIGAVSIATGAAGGTCGPPPSGCVVAPPMTLVESDATPTPTRTSTPTPTFTPGGGAPTPTSTSTITPTPVFTPGGGEETPTPTPTLTLPGTETPTPTFTPGGGAPTPTPTITRTPTPTVTATP